MCLLTLLRRAGQPGNVPLVMIAEVQESKFSRTNASQAFGSVMCINILLAKVKSISQAQSQGARKQALPREVWVVKEKVNISQ